MNDLLDDDDAPLSHNERELTLSTGAILGIFFGLVLLCGACFGVGYNMGRKSAPTPLALNDANSGENLAEAGSSPKPAAGSPVDTPAPSSVVTTTTPPPAAPKPSPVVRKPTAPPVEESSAEPTTPPPPTRTATAAPAPIVRTVPPAALLPGAASPPAQGGSFVVQIAAVSHQDDADLLIGALRARGYTVSARPSSADSFIHVQVGPFSNKKDAEAMRQRLIGDGYNAIVK